MGDQTDDDFCGGLAEELELEGVGSGSVVDDVIKGVADVQLVGERDCSTNAVGVDDQTAGGVMGEKGFGCEEGGGIKVVQWSAFSSVAEETACSEFGPFTDFPTEGSVEGSFEMECCHDPKASGAENQVVEDPGTDVGSCFREHEGQGGKLNTLDSGCQEEQLQDGGVSNDPQCWESVYPGWKYDSGTGQWYQVNSVDLTYAGDTNGHDVSTQASLEGSHHMSGDALQSVSEVVLDQGPHASYPNENSQSSMQCISEKLNTVTTLNANQVSQVTQFPSNMLFDPQYPGWYYDTNTNEWYSLESYNQHAHLVLDSNHKETIPGDNNASDRFSEQNRSCDNESHGTLFEKQSLLGHTSQELVAQDGLVNSFYQPNAWQYDAVGNQFRQQANCDTTELISQQNYGKSESTHMFQGFSPVESTYQLSPSSFEESRHTNVPLFHDKQNMISYSQQQFPSGNASSVQLSYAPKEERSSAGHPPHALVTFGFGGKIIVMKESDATLTSGIQGPPGGTIFVLNLMEIMVENNVCSSIELHGHDYFDSLCNQSFPGPLVGATFATKDLNKWIDERITICQSSYMDFKKGELLRLLLSLLKLSYQHYGKLRSPFGSDTLSMETGGPELDVTSLFADAKKSSIDSRLRDYGSLTSCMRILPSEGQIQATAIEVQKLLIVGKRKEALQRAQEGLLWGPALVLAAQLGEKFYVDTVKQMALHQFVSGSPLRTICLLIAGQPADVFSTNNPNQGSENGMLDNWEENLAVITANRTKDDELVIVHLGDCLWKDQGEITAAHTCYLLAEANFESYSDTARLCLIGADHWKCPRTYASPAAIQRTEFYEYSKVHGNPQFVLLPFQPYKILYAYMLAEVGKSSDALRYCQAMLKLLKTSSRAPEVELWKHLASSLEERLRTHQQGGYGTNLAPAKFVGKIFTSIDRSISRIIGSPPPSAPSTMPNDIRSNENDRFNGVPRVANSHSTMAMSSLMPSASVETISEWTGDERRVMHGRSASEPNFGKSLKQMSPTSDRSSADGQSKLSSSGGSMLGRIGSQLFQKTVGWVSRSNQAKLGERNKFYYDKELDRWVEEGAEPPAQETSIPPPPTSFHTSVPDYNINDAFRSQTSSANDEMEIKSSIAKGHSPGIPPIPPGQNQFSARGRAGVRSRYVDTFNKGAVSASSFQLPTIPSPKPINTSKLFVPSPVPTKSAENSTPEDSSDENGFSTTSFSSPPSMPPLQRYPSMNNIPTGENQGNQPAFHMKMKTRTRAASWDGGLSDPLQNKSFRKLSLPSSNTHINPPLLNKNVVSSQFNGGDLGEDLDEVEL